MQGVGKHKKDKPPSCGLMNKRNPAAIPTGTVVANDNIIDGRRVRDLVGSVAIRVPSDKPSNNWWNVTAVTREADAGMAFKIGLDRSHTGTLTEF